VDMSGITNQYFKMPHEFRDLFIPFFKKLRFKDEIYQKADSILNGLDLTKCVGVLVREGDYTVYSRATKPENFFRLIDKLDPTLSIILCCQNTQTLKLFKKKYGKRIISQIEHYDAKDSERMKEVAVNMVLLSRCPHLIGNIGSCFMEAAWFYGECKADVTKVT